MTWRWARDLYLSMGTFALVMMSVKEGDWMEAGAWGCVMLRSASDLYDRTAEMVSKARSAPSPSQGEGQPPNPKPKAEGP